jgi:hypothetical protein
MRKPVWSLALVCAMAACGGEEDRRGSDAAVAPMSPLEEFASYWADSSAWCAYDAACGFIAVTDCVATWPSRDESRAAVQALAEADIVACMAVARTLDGCVLKLSCDRYEQGCVSERLQYNDTCRGVQAGLKAYFTAHPRVPFLGSFRGSYTGSEAGAFSGSIEPLGGVNAQISSPAVSKLSATGSARGNGAFSLSARGQSRAGTFTITYTGTLTMGAGAAYTGSGTWRSTTGGDGGWSLESL